MPKSLIILDHSAIHQNHKFSKYFLNIFTSSANDDTVEEHPPDMSFTYCINRSGPKIEPCGTPDVTGKLSDCLPSTIIVRLLSDRLLVNLFKSLLLKTKRLKEWENE